MFNQRREKKNVFRRCNKKGTPLHPTKAAVLVLVDM